MFSNNIRQSCLHNEVAPKGCRTENRLTQILVYHINIYHKRERYSLPNLAKFWSEPRVDGQVACLANWLRDCLAAQMADWLAAWLAGSLVVWEPGWLLGILAASLAGWHMPMACGFVCALCVSWLCCAACFCNLWPQKSHTIHSCFLCDWTMFSFLAFHWPWPCL